MRRRAVGTKIESTIDEGIISKCDVDSEREPFYYFFFGENEPVLFFVCLSLVACTSIISLSIGGNWQSRGLGLGAHFRKKKKVKICFSSAVDVAHLSGRHNTK